MFNLTTKVNTINAVVLWEHLNYKLGVRDYDVYWQELTTLLQWYVDNQVDGFHTFSYNTYESAGHVTMDLTEAMVRVYVSSIQQCTNELILDVSYLFNGVQSVQYLQSLHQQHIPLPAVDVDEYTMDSLEFVEIVNKGRVDLGKPLLQHKSVLTKVGKLINDRTQQNILLSYLDLRVCDSSYIDDSGRSCKKVNMSSDFALSLGMTYDLQTRDIVQNEMNRLHAYIVQTPVIITPVLPTMTELQPPPPVSDNDTMVSQARAEEITHIVMDAALLVSVSNIHNCPIVQCAIDGVMTNTYHSFVYAVAYNIPVNTWTSITTHHLIK